MDVKNIMQCGVDVLGFPIFVEHTTIIKRKKWKKHISEEITQSQKIVKQH